MKNIISFLTVIFLFAQIAAAKTDIHINNHVAATRYTKTPMRFKSYGSYLKYVSIKTWKGVDSANAFYRKELGNALLYTDYLPLTAGSSYPLSGALYGTDANFSGKLGIGITSPYYQAQINSSGVNSYMQFTSLTTGTEITDGFIIGTGDAGDAILINRENTNMRLYTNSTEKMRITNSGSLGLGTTLPNIAGWVGGAFTIKAGGNIGLEIVDTTATADTANVGGIRFFAGSSSSNMVGQMAVDVKGTGQNSGRLRLGTNNAGTYTDAIVIDNFGNVGIGTSNPGINTAAGSSHYLTVESPARAMMELATSAADADGIILGQLGFYGRNTTGSHGKQHASILSFANGTASADRGGTLQMYTKADGGALVERMDIDASGNVGMGTATPTSSLEIQKNQDSLTSFKIKNINNNANAATAITISSQNQLIRLFAFSDAYSRSYPGFHPASVVLEGSATNGLNIISDKGSGTAGSNTGMIRFITDSSSDVSATTIGNDSLVRMVIRPDGRVGIGIISPTEKLSVNGNVRAKKVIVTQTGWSDYVFNDNYPLRSLQQVESFIKQNKHLPDVPSAREVEENGISIGENQALLLKKIEELTLYMIEIKKENERLKSAMYSMGNEFRKMKEQVSNQ